MTCRKQKFGNIWQDNLPSEGPYEGGYIHECSDENSYTKTSKYFYTNVKPQRVQSVRQCIRPSLTEPEPEPQVNNFWVRIPQRLQNGGRRK